MGYQPPLPNSSRLNDKGHSWVATPNNPYGASNIATGTSGWPADREQWPSSLRDALGISSTGYTKTYSVPAVATTSTETLFLDVMPEDGNIEAVWYVPISSLGTSNSNYRTFYVSHVEQAGGTVGTIGSINTSVSAVPGGAALVSGTPALLYSIHQTSSPISSGHVQVIDTPYTPALYAGTAGMIPTLIYWQTIVTGTLSDGGGIVIIRYGTRYRNYGVSGATLLGNASLGVNQYGSWWSNFSFAPFSRPNAVEVNVNGAGYTTGGTSLPCSPLQYALLAGQSIQFSNGATATPAGATAFGATSITVPSGTGSIPAGNQGHYRSTPIAFAGGYESLSPSGINVWTHGLNDGTSSTQDVPAWGEASRAVIARDCCPAWDYSNEGNFLTSGSTWGTLSPVANGMLPYALGNYYSGTAAGAIATYKLWTGTPASQTCAITVGPAFEGGTIDLMLLAIAGSGVGVAGTVVATGYSGTFNTGSVSTSGLLTRTLGGTAFAATSSATIAVTGGTPDMTTADVGKVVTFTGGTGSVPAGTIITGVASTSSFTISNTVTLAATAGQTRQYVPMVKRITGLAAGSQTITLTVTASDSVANSALIVHGIGLESQNPATPVLWCDIARCPAQTSGQQNNDAALNASSQAVINGPITLTSSANSGSTITFALPVFVNANMTVTGPGVSGIAVSSVNYTTGVVTLASGTPTGGSYVFTLTPVTGNGAEPAFGTNVQFVDIDTLFGGATPNTKLFLPDGLHPNSLGHRLMARTLFSTIRNNFSPDQLIAR